MAPTATASSGTLTLQGQTVPAESINGPLFFANTRRKRHTEYNKVFAGFGLVDNAELLKSDIISVAYVRFTGTLTIVHSTGSVAATFRWPHDLLANAKFVANGQSNLINVSGGKLKVREQMSNAGISDRGVAQSVSGATVTQGTLSMASELWGVGPGATAIASGAYPVELLWKIPIAEDETDLSGAIFCQTAALDLTLSLTWNTLAALFTVTGNDTVALTGNCVVETEKYSIPVVGNNFVIPDLSMFHSLVQTTVSNQLGQGDNQPRLLGQGSGKQLLRAFWQLWNGNAPQVPLAMTAANFGPQGWIYGTSENPEQYLDGRSLREFNEQLYDSDIGAVFGFGCHDFAATWAFRDAVDMGQTSDLRLSINILAALTNPSLEYVQETMFSAGSAA